jgi:aspartate kinase
MKKKTSLKNKKSKVKHIVIVQKYGGATLESPEKIIKVAKKISKLHKSGTRVVACVSAMGKSTNQLIALAHQVSSVPNQRELDMLLTTGERVSMALVSMALNDLNCPAISFTGSQAGILTNDSHVNANIIDVKAYRIDEALKKNQVVVLAGFQGVSPRTKEITTLGRGGTDTTAVAMSAYLKAQHCEILKDVAGVFTADPNLIKNAKPIRNISYEQMLEMTFWGAKVLHYRAVELAKQKNIKIYIGPAHKSFSLGTVISKGTKNKMYESSQILSINSHDQVLVLSSRFSLHEIKNLLKKSDVGFPQILISQKVKNSFEYFITGPTEILSDIKKIKTTKFKISKKVFSSVTATCTGVAGEEIYDFTQKQLMINKVTPVFILTSGMSLTFIIPQPQKQKAISTLHRYAVPFP